MKKLLLIVLLLMPLLHRAQNLVPNPSFEDTTNCSFTFADIDCLNDWNLYSAANNPVLNTSDLCYNGAVFFPPSTINAYDGVKYIGVDCQPINSEYVQARLTQPMQAGMTYCVSFYASVCSQTGAAPSLGAYFSVNPLTVNPFTTGMNAHVQSTITFNPALWQQVSGTYVANGGEEYITLGGFQNGSMTTITYMYIDYVEVTACPPPPPPPPPTPQPSDSSIYLPNAFTPNGDGVNETFPALGEGVSDFKIDVFNRWGQLIFTSTSLANQWDGRCKGREVPEGVYVYKLSCKIGSEPINKIGHIVLVR